MVHKAPNGVEDEVSMLWDYGPGSDGLVVSLGTSYRCRMPNMACILGEEGNILIPDFFRAHECSLYHLDTCIDHFEDGRKSIGLNYEAIACGEAILAGRQQSEIMPWPSTIRFQNIMSSIRARF